MKKRNGLIELYRFFFALNVVKSHGFFPEGLSYFSPGRVSVEFFFVLSGYLFVRTLDRLRSEPLGRGILKVISSRLRPLLVPLVIGLISNLAYNIVTKEYFDGLWGYLWYVHAMLLASIGYFILRKLIKSDRAFFYTVLGICIAATLMRFSGVFYSWGYVRAASTMSLGMLISRIPKIKLKHQNLLWLIVAPLQLAALTVVCFHLGNIEWFGGFMGVEAILDLIIYPALIYFTFCLEVNSRIMCYLGALSFGLYAYQCPADLLRALGVSSRYLLLGFIVLCTLVDDGVKRILKKRAEKQHIQ